MKRYIVDSHGNMAEYESGSFCYFSDHEKAISELNSVVAEKDERIKRLTEALKDIMKEYPNCLRVKLIADKALSEGGDKHE